MRTARLFLPRLRRNVGGFTLLELLIAMTIGLVILASSLSLYVASSRGSQMSQVETQLNEDGILALNLIQQQLKQAGYSRQIIPASGAAVMGNYAGPAVRGCDGGFTDSSVAFGDLACTTGAGSDAIAIRYEATSDNTTPTNDATPLATNCVGNGINPVTASQVSPPPTPASAAGSYALADNRYSVTNANTQPMLSCRGSEKNGSSSTDNVIGTSWLPLLANVESMQILYGVASRPSAELAATYDPMRHQIISYLSASGVDALTSTGVLPNVTEDRWGRVLSVRVCLLMRSDQPVKDAPTGGMAYKDCNNIDASGTDGYLRRTYTTTVLLRNRVIVQ
ncbi:prepilin-type cleavage/methylation domain-containing protein [Variovorax sp. KBW07]|uniref:PilW family protein n=1 Tax=Variovorax sp. KBW07 TaxID=2153358 RepID=UPI000F55A8A7|nr:PilW family protein [Variovorax sp. KBW07]RQO62904.1 prepilin-type cleavage/methylation domain-containing protein [Variovorax sp. KBW07]